MNDLEPLNYRDQEEDDGDDRPHGGGGDGGAAPLGEVKP